MKRSPSGLLFSRTWTYHLLYNHYPPVELLDLRDLAVALALVEELVMHPPATEELAFLRD
jgi:hypothetical protein